MTGSATDPLDWQQHVRNKPRRQEMADRFKDPNDDFRLAIVRDMWLTGFDCPSLHTRGRHPGRCSPPPGCRDVWGMIAAGTTRVKQSRRSRMQADFLLDFSANFIVGRR